MKVAEQSCLGKCTFQAGSNGRGGQDQEGLGLGRERAKSPAPCTGALAQGTWRTDDSQFDPFYLQISHHGTTTF